MVRITDYLEELDKEVVLDDNQYRDSREVSRRIKDGDPRSILFTKPFKNKDPLVANLYSTLSKIEKLMHIEEGSLFTVMSDAKHNLIKPVAKDWDGDKFDSDRISRMPILKYYEGDAGRYVTSSIVVAKDPEDGVVNMSVHRLLHLDSNKFAVRMVEGRHLYQIFEKHRAEGTDLKVAILVGTPAHIILSASTQIPKDLSELEYAGGLKGRPIEVFSLEDSGLYVPLESEYVFEGRIRIGLKAREWMTDILGLYDKPRDQPILEVENVYTKISPIYHAILPGGLEHKTLMGYPAEVKIREALIKKGIKVRDLWLSSGSGGWLHCFVSISKEDDDEPYRSIKLVIETHMSVKGVVVVDDDINPRDYEEIDFAMATRFQDKKKVYFFEKMQGSSLDPSSDQERLLTSKWGLDLTLPKETDKKRFLRGRI